jgi:DNA-binding XRE family transcriptional regulator
MEDQALPLTQHGHNKRGQKTATYNAWANMLRRCTTPSHPSFPDYGGRGIGVCDRWRVYANFLADVGERPSPELSLDRIDNEGHYEPGNIRWTTRSVQNRNTRYVKLTADLVQEIHGRCEHGESQKSVAQRMGVDPSTISDIRRGKCWKEFALCQ